MANTASKSSGGTKTRRSASPRTSRRSARRTQSTATIDGMEPLADALNTEVRVRVPASAIIAFAIVVVLLLFTAAVSASWLFAVPTIALAMAAGWLIATSRSV